MSKQITIEGEARIRFSYTTTVADDFEYDEDNLDDDTAEKLAEVCDEHLPDILVNGTPHITVEIENWYPAK